MFTLFRRSWTKPSTIRAPDPRDTKGLLLPQSAAALLEIPRRQRLLEHIWQRVSLSRAQFAALYRAPIERYAALVQQFPASESHHHAYAGGMLDHGLEIVAYALKLRQSHLLPVGCPPEIQAAQAEAWTAGTAYAALLHDIGKVAVDLHVEFADGSLWHPWHGPPSRLYRFRYRKDRDYKLHTAAAGLLYMDILDRPLLDWLSGFPELWNALLHVLAGQYEHAGVLGELVQQADQSSVAQDLGGNPAKATQAPKHALQRKLLDGLRYLIKEQLKLNQPEASDAWLTQDALWLVSKTVCDKLRAHLLSQGIEGVPDRNTTVFDVLQDHGIAQPSPDGKAIWRATVVSQSGWTHPFTFLRVAPALIWDGGARPPPFSGTVRTDGTGPSDESARARVDNTPTLEETLRAPSSESGQVPAKISGDSPPGDPIASTLALFTPSVPPNTVEPNRQLTTGQVAQSTTLPPDRDATGVPLLARPIIGATGVTTQPGERFLAWLRDGVQTRHLIINDSKALVHTVAGTVFLVTPGLFQRYVQEHPDVARIARKDALDGWQWAQKSFERMRLHKRQDSGLNIWTCAVTGPRKTRQLYGYLLADGHTVIPELPPDNPYLTLQQGTLEPPTRR